MYFNILKWTLRKLSNVPLIVIMPSKNFFRILTMQKMCVQKFLINEKQREKCLKIQLQNTQSNDYKTKHKKLSKQFKQFNLILNKTSKFIASHRIFQDVNLHIKIIKIKNINEMLYFQFTCI